MATASNSATNQSQGPAQLSLPSAGGAITGFGEQFQSGGFTGAMGITAGGVSYSSQSSNGEFGMGFGMASEGGISRRTAHGTPTYDDEMDQFVWGENVLVPKLDKNNEPVLLGGNILPTDQLPWRRPVLNEQGVGSRDSYLVRVYHFRKESDFSKIEYWKWNREETSEDEPTSFWRIISGANAESLFGVSKIAQIYNPENPEQIYRWLPEETLSPSGHSAIVTYKAENTIGVEMENASEANRSQTAQRYIHKSYSGQQNPFPEPLSFVEDQAFKKQKMEAFFVINAYDYGQYNLGLFESIPIDIYNQEGEDWIKREDSISNCVSGFEVRTHRLCTHVLTFHRFTVFDEEFAYLNLPAGTPLLNHITRYHYDQSPVRSLMTATDEAGFYLRNDQNSAGKYEIKYSVPIEYKYSDFQPTTGTYRELRNGKTNQPLKAFGTGLDYHMIDLYGEGIPGWLWSDGNDVQYLQTNWDSIKKNNSDPIFYLNSPSDNLLPINRLLPGYEFHFMDITGNGQLDILVKHSGGVGYYEAQQDGSWDNYQPLPYFPIEDFSPRVNLLDINGNGRLDVCMVMDHGIRYYPNLGTDGFGEAIEVKSNLPRSIVSSEAELFLFADMTGDGRSDLVRVTNEGLKYYMNQGNGHFSEAIQMDNFPIISYNDFRADRVFFADVDGTGTNDMLLFTRDGIKLWLNQCGNSFGSLMQIPLPEGITYDPLDQIMFNDVFGMGLPSLVYIKTHPQPKQYVFDFCCGLKPYLMVEYNNNMGAKTEVNHVSSSHFYLQDQAKGINWVSRAPFPVWVTGSVTSIDEISRTTLHTENWYRHSYYDGIEREFRGFGFSMHQDTQRFSDFRKKYDSPPSLSKSWYHTGSPDQNSLTKQYEKEYFQGDQVQQNLPDSHINYNGFLTQLEVENQVDEINREAQMLMKGTVLRAEVYGLNDALLGGQDDFFGQMLTQNGSVIYSDSQVPYTVSESNVEVRLLQPKAGNLYGSFMVLEHESLSLNYEQNPDDPLVAYFAPLVYDEYGHALQSCTVEYGRRMGKENANLDPDETVAREQQSIRIYTHFASVYNIDTTKNKNALGRLSEMDQFYALGIPVEAWTYRVENGPFNKDTLPDGQIYPWWMLKAFLTPLPLEVPSDWQLPDISEQYFLNGKAVDQSSDPVEDLLKPQYVLRSWGAQDYYYPLEGSQKEEIDTNYAHITYINLERNTSRGHLLSKQSWVAAYNREELLDKNLLGHFFPTTDDLDDLMVTNGSYVLNANNSNGDNGLYWVRSGLSDYSVWNQFYLANSYTDPLGTTTSYQYDQYNLMMVETTDALNNQTSILGIDYQVLHPYKIQDQNANISEVVFDAMGRVITTSHFGYIPGDQGEGVREGFDELFIGSQLEGYKIEDKIQKPIASVLAEQEKFLQGAGGFIEYYPFSWMRQLHVSDYEQVGLSSENAIRWIELLQKYRLINGEMALFDRLKTIAKATKMSTSEFINLLSEISPELGQFYASLTDSDQDSIIKMISEEKERQPVHILSILPEDYPDKSNAYLSKDDYDAYTVMSKHEILVWWNVLQSESLLDDIGVFSPDLRRIRENSQSAVDLEAEFASHGYNETAQVYQNLNERIQEEIFMLLQRALRVRIKKAIAYNDGFGRSVQSKIKSEDGHESLLYNHETGKVSDNSRDKVVFDRWLTEGHTVYNNKGQIVRQYDPFWINTFRFVDSEKIDYIGTSPILYYDAVGRVYQLISNKGFMIRHAWTSWENRMYDPNDTFLISPYFKVNRSIILEDGQPPTPQLMALYGEYYDPEMSLEDRLAYRKVFLQGFSPGYAIHENRGLTLVAAECTDYKFGIDHFEDIVEKSEELYKELVSKEILRENTLIDVSPNDEEFGPFVVGPVINKEGFDTPVGTAIWGVAEVNFPVSDIILQLDLPDKFALESGKIINILMQKEGMILTSTDLFKAFLEFYGRSPFDQYECNVLWHILKIQNLISKEQKVKGVKYPQLGLSSSFDSFNNEIVKSLVNGWVLGNNVENRTEYDGQGRTVAVADARLYANGYWTMKTFYPKTIGASPHVNNCDAGPSWIMMNAIGIALWGVEARGVRSIPVYDILHRSLTEEVSWLNIDHISGGSLLINDITEIVEDEDRNSPPSLIWGPYYMCRVNYGESAFVPKNADQVTEDRAYELSQLYNLRGRTVQKFDQSGWYSMNKGYNIQGLPIGSEMIYTIAYKPSEEYMKKLALDPAYIVPPLVNVPPLSNMPNLPDDISKDPETGQLEGLLQYTSEGFSRYFLSGFYDAVGRPVKSLDVDNNVHQSIFAETGWLSAQYVNGIPFMKNIVYNAKGMEISYDCNKSEDEMVVRTYHTFDRKNYRTIQIYSTVAKSPIEREDEYTLIETDQENLDTRQNLVYTFDPVGNVMSINGQYQGWTEVDQQGNPLEEREYKVFPSSGIYSYDPLYRLVVAEQTSGEDIQDE